MIRILHSVSNMDRAGIETMLMNYYRYMDKSKVQFDFLCNKKKPGAYDDEIKSMGGRIYHTPGLNPAKYPVYLKYMRELFQEHPEYKIVEAHNGALGVYALHAAKVSKIPVRIFHAHGASITKDWKLPIKLVCKACLPTNMTHHFSCGVEAAKCYFGQKVVDENDYVLIPNAIDVARFIYNPKIRNKIRKENNLENKHVVGHVGRFMAQKNHTFLMDVFAEVLKIDSQAHLVLLGDGELMDEIKRKTADLGISEHVTFVGNVGNANEWYQAFDCFVLPSIWEGLPVVGVEAQAADLPCVFSSAITREIGLSQRAKFVPLTESVSVWAKTLCDALQQNERNDNTKLITEHHYNIAFEAKKLQERYLQLAGQLRTFTKYERSIPRTRSVKTAKEIIDLKLDLIVLGSDEIWNLCGSGYHPLKFGTGLENQRTIAYAPSVGAVTEETAVPEDVFSGLKHLDRISGRDVESLKFVERACGRKAEKMLDPTFLYNFDMDIERENIKPKPYRYILIYDCKLTEPMAKQLQEYAKKNDLKIIGAGDYKTFYDEGFIDLTPYEWVDLFRNAEKVITGTFHGTVFSIKYNKSVLCYPTEKNRINKIRSLLSDMKIASRLLEVGCEDDFIPLLDTPMDYTETRNYIAQKIQEADDFLTGDKS